jgi:hypothetical protein
VQGEREDEDKNVEEGKEQENDEPMITKEDLRDYPSQQGNSR